MESTENKSNGMKKKHSNNQLKKQGLMILTSSGLVPYDQIKDSLPKEIVDAIESQVDYINTVSNKENVEYYIVRLAQKKHWEIRKMYSYLANLNKFSPAAELNVILMEIAYELDEQYEDQIQNSEEIYTISPYNGKVIKLDKKDIKNFKSFPAFRTLEDAKFAHKVVSKKIKAMFKGNGKQEN